MDDGFLIWIVCFIILILFLPFIFAFLVIAAIITLFYYIIKFILHPFENKRPCKFIGRCKWYDKDSITCNETGGDYYGPGRPAGCYRQLEARKLEARKLESRQQQQKERNKPKAKEAEK